MVVRCVHRGGASRSVARDFFEFVNVVRICEYSSGFRARRIWNIQRWKFDFGLFVLSDSLFAYYDSSYFKRTYVRSIKPVDTWILSRIHALTKSVRENVHGSVRLTC